MLNFVLMRSAFCRGVALYAPWGETGLLFTHTNKDFGAKLRRADDEDGASAYRIGSVSDYGAL